MSNVSKRRREGVRNRVKTLGDHKEFLKRISKSLYYGKLPSLPCLSLPVTEISAELFSEAQRGRSLKRLHVDAAAEVARSACISPCSLVLAILYLERLKTSNPDYLARVAPSELFLVSLMVSNKFLQDDGEDGVFIDEWATSGKVDIKTIKQLEKNFLNAIDWKIYVSDDAFESGLSWLERQVALKQANLRGFFTYADLAASSEEFNIGDIFKTLTSMCVAVTLSYVTSLLAVITSTLLITNSFLPSMQHSQACSPTIVDSNNTMHTSLLPPNTEANDTPDDTMLHNQEFDFMSDNLDKILTSQGEINKLTCCSQWWKPSKPEITLNWLDGVVLTHRQDTQQGWWWHTSVGNWLYQFSLISPLQKWLDKLEEWSGLINMDILNYTGDNFDKCYRRDGKATFNVDKSECRNIWLHNGQFSGLISIDR